MIFYLKIIKSTICVSINILTFYLYKVTYQSEEPDGWSVFFVFFHFFFLYLETRSHIHVHAHKHIQIYTNKPPNIIYNMTMMHYVKLHVLAAVQ